MARNKFDVDERLETPFDFRHLKRVGVYIGKHKWKMLLALLLSALASGYCFCSTDSATHGVQS